jgi:hypothetical protein
MRIEWRLNGVTVALDAAPAGRPAGQPLRLARTVVLDEGENTLEVVAYNSANLIASVPLREIYFVARVGRHMRAARVLAEGLG